MDVRTRPILFSAPMVRSLLAGSKTQTRRIVKNPDYFACLTGDCDHHYQTDCDAFMATQAPYGVPGDLLWVKESHHLVALGDGHSVLYAAAPDIDTVLQHPTWTAREKRRRPSIHMPRWASRLTLEIADVRVERLQDISEEDALAEGLSRENVIVGADNAGGRHREISEDRYFFDGGPDEGLKHASDAYMALWNSINGPDADFANPWVWAISFQAHQQNVDALLKERDAA